MRKLLTCFFSLMVAAPTMAADVVASRTLPTVSTASDLAGKNTEKTSDSTAEKKDIVRSGVRTVPSRTLPTSDGAKKNIESDESATTPAVRSAVSRVFSGTSVAEPVETDSSSRVAAISRAVGAAGNTDTSARGKLNATVNTVGRNSRVSAASINSDPAVRRAGLVLRPSTAEVGGRAIIGNTGVQTGSNMDDAVRKITSRAATESTRESIADATARLEQTAALNKSCQQQYNECMDQFCAVLDANQKRCSCSSNLNRYTRVESAVKDANTQLNEVAQRIRYVGLSADEIRAIMNETEAEQALSGTVDTSTNRNMLEAIEDLIRDPVSSTSYSADTYTSLDMNLDFSSGTSDMFSLDFLNTGTGGSFSNLRGTDLYNAAKRRCNTILNKCKEAGATIQQITGNYDLAIDKDCVSYEQGLTKMNETLVSNVRSANLMLQKARLAVLQNKNQYDAKGCIAALENCMKDDMVCGDDYFKCVDPTKTYIDENGEVILGQKISNITAFMTKYNNASITDEYLENAYENQVISSDKCTEDTTDSTAKGGNDGSCMVKYLLKKIGTGQNITDEGLCRAVLDKCQRYTYTNDGKYDAYNDIVVNYIQRAMVNIRAAQYNIISDYSSTCMVDIANCYNQQVTQVNTWSSAATADSVYKVMRGACRNVALTCAYAVFAEDKESCPTTGNVIADTCINSISNMFYQSLLCPDNSTYQTQTAGCTDTSRCVNTRCQCNSGYTPQGTSCIKSSTSGQ